MFCYIALLVFMISNNRLKMNCSNSVQFLKLIITMGEDIVRHIGDKSLDNPRFNHESPHMEEGVCLSVLFPFLQHLIFHVGYHCYDYSNSKRVFGI